MEKTHEPASRNARTGGHWGAVYWLAMVVVLYILFSGPAIRLYEIGPFKKNPVLGVMYCPMMWLYEHSLLQRPIGIYWHLWDPKQFDKNGGFILDLSTATISFGTPATNTPAAPPQK